MAVVAHGIPVILFKAQTELGTTTRAARQTAAERFSTSLAVATFPSYLQNKRYIGRRNED